MAYNKAKEENKWKQWKEQEKKKMRELGVSEKVIAELRGYDWKCFKQERNYQTHQMPDTDFIERTEDISGKWEIQQPVNVQDFIKSLDDNKLRKELLKLDQVTLYIILLKTFGYGTEEIGKLLEMKANTVSARMKRLRKKLKKYFF
ncbi:sigma-70 family RNA polymerase sigma factor [Lacrimispora saccharolytica]|nr:sigma-70 family RNA polymerase sigma factor [Lacrimispora saccharolytica]